jgi:hypothetical protein
VFLVLAALATTASAAPAADVVVVWAPGTSIRPIEDAARHRGAALIDRSPQPPANAETLRFLQRGIELYKSIRLDEAQAALDQARDLADKTGAAGLTRSQLSDLFLYRGLVRAAQDDETAAWDELVSAIVIQPTRTLDPTQYAPKVAALLERVQNDVLQKHPQAKLAIDAPDGCTVEVDGEPVAGAVLRPTGPHWVRVTCPDHAPWATRVDLTTLDSHLASAPKPYEPPAETELLVQGRTAGARAIAVVEVHGKIATVRVLGIDGRERERRTVTVTRGDLAPVARVLDDLLAPPVVSHTVWYRSRWAWAVGAAIATAAIVVPVTAVIAGDTGATSWTVRPKGLP